MKELYDAAFAGVNLIPTIFFVFTSVYWLIVLIGFADLNSLDFHVEADVDADVDIDAHIDAHTDTDVDADGHAGISSGGAGWFISTLAFFNIGKVPFMIFMSFFTLPFWVISLSANHILGNSSFLIALVLFVPNIIVSLFFAKFLTFPLAKLFQRLDRESNEDESIIGRIGKARTAFNDKRFGQIEVIYKDVPAVFHAITVEDQELNKNETCLILDYNEDKKLYIVEPYKN